MLTQFGSANAIAWQQRVADARRHAARQVRDGHGGRPDGRLPAVVERRHRLQAAHQIAPRARRPTEEPHPAPMLGETAMKIHVFAAAIALTAGVASAQTPPTASAPAAPAASAQQATPPALPSCPELAAAVQAASRNDVRLRDWPNLVALPRGEPRARRAWPRARTASSSWATRSPTRGRSRASALLPRQAVRRPRHQRADDAADAPPVSARCRRPQAEGRGHPGRHQRHRRQHRADDRRSRSRATSRRWPRSRKANGIRVVFSSILPVSEYHVGRDTRRAPDHAAADGAHHGDQRLDEGLRRRRTATSTSTTSRR